MKPSDANDTKQGAAYTLDGASSACPEERTLNAREQTSS
jgi:hypothetical protein